MTQEVAAVTGPSVAEVLARAGIGHRVPAGAAGLPGMVREVALLTDDRPRAGSLLIASWTAARRDGALPPLLPLVQRASSLGAAGLLVVTGKRQVDPAQDACALADRVALPLIWVDQRVSTSRVAHVMSEAIAGLASAEPDRRLVLSQALSTILGTGVDQESVLHAARLLPVAGVRIAVSMPAESTVLVDWADEAGSAAHPGLHHLTLDLAAGGNIELTCTRPLTADERAYAANLSSLLDLWLRSRRRADAPSVDEVQEELLRAVLGTDLSARETAIRRSRRLGVFPPRRCLVLVIEPFGHRLTATGLNTLSRNVINAVRPRDSKASVMVREGGILVIVAEHVDLPALVTDLLRRAGLPVCIGVSTPVASIERLPGGYRQAQRSTTLAQQLGRVNTMTRYDDLGFYRLLVLIPEHERSLFVTEVLGSLAGDGAEQADLRRTLRVVGENRGNIKAAAERLFIHPNTLRQRIGKLSQVLGPFLDDADAYLNVYLALALHRLKDRE